ncbi:MAG TPA: hypothetical protein VLF39_02475 [Candidatus Saccharimonadales bacterium]|nr:hypothetical protein [Candidatus Saccharimonadales bacterium]
MKKLVAASIIIVLLVTGGYYWHKNNKTSTRTVAVNVQQNDDKYYGWKTSVSTWTGFTIHYPSNWSYTAQVGNKDDTEHIIIDSNKFHITIDTFKSANGLHDNVTDTKCTDCKEVISSQPFRMNNLGVVNLENVTYSLDNGTGNALILQQANGEYLIKSPKIPGVYSKFRGISKLNSLQDYQSETNAQFNANPDLKIAKLILESVRY